MVYAFRTFLALGAGRAEGKLGPSLRVAMCCFNTLVLDAFGGMESRNYRRQRDAGGLIWLRVLSRTMRRVWMFLVLDFRPQSLL